MGTPRCVWVVVLAGLLVMGAFGQGEDNGRTGGQHQNVDGGQGSESNNSSGTDGGSAETSKHKTDIEEGGACAQAETLYCKGTKRGDQKMLHCLTMVMVKEWDGVQGASIGASCMEELMDFKLHHSKNIDADIYLKEACEDDIKNLCENAKVPHTHNSMGPKIACLRKKRAKATPLCQQELFRLMREAAFDYRLDGALNEACAEEVNENCSKKIPGEGRVLRCLYNRAFQDTANNECKREVLRQLREGASDIRLNFQFQNLCASDIQKFCKGVPPGGQKLQMCLADHRDEDGFDERCHAIVVETLVRHLKDIAEDTMLTSSCQSDLQNTCQMTEEHLSTLNVASAESTKMIQCLIKHRDTLPKGCTSQIERILQNQFKDLRLNPALESQCGEDIKQHCENVPKDEGKVIGCLLSVRKDLKSQCKILLFHEREVRNENINFNIQLKTACAADITRFCPKVVPGGGRLISCLSTRLDDEAMSGTCKEALSLLRHTSAQDYRLNHKLQVACQEDAEKICRSACNMADDGPACDGKVIACLQWHATEGIHKQGVPKVSEKCRRELDPISEQQAMDYRNNEVIASACHKNIEDYCTKPAQGEPITPGQGRIFQCLFDNFDKLDEDCKKQELRFAIVQADKVKTQPKLLMMCQSEIYTFCHKVRAVKNAVIGCLAATYRTSPRQFSVDCEEGLKVVFQQQLKDYRLSMGVREYCESSIEQLQCKKAENENNSLNQGAVLGCLTRNFRNIVTDIADVKQRKCAMGVRKIVQNGLNFYQPGVPVTNVCDQDMERICKNTVGMNPAECLYQYTHSGKGQLSLECNQLVEIADPPHSIEKQIAEKDPNQEIKLQQVQELVNKVTKLDQKIGEDGLNPQTSSSDTNLVIGAIVVLGALVVAAVGAGIWAIRKYLNKGYVVMKSGDV